MPGQPFKITLALTTLSMTLYLVLLSFIQYPLTTILKPIPILFLMLYTLQVNPRRQVKILLLSALGCSLLGDIILTLPIKTALEGGILAFMATHCIYIGLFLKNKHVQKKRLAFFLPLLALVIGGFYYLWPSLGEMKIPVTVYLCVLTLMVFCAFQVKQHPLLISSGALLFLLSDFILALNLFVLPAHKTAAILIMLLYYMAQFLLVLGITEIK